MSVLTVALLAIGSVGIGVATKLLVRPFWRSIALSTVLAMAYGAVVVWLTVR